MRDTQHDLIDKAKSKGFDSYYDSFGDCWRLSKGSNEYKLVIKEKKLTASKSGNIIYNASIPETESEIDTFIKLVL
jgi:hypothetical protein